MEIESKIDFSKDYDINQGNILLDISDAFYSNYAIIQISNRDVYIDFLELPGIKKEGRMTVSGKRILLPHAVAQKLAEVIIANLENSYKTGKLEQYKPSEEESE
jgi:hypothetical protein